MINYDTILTLFSITFLILVVCGVTEMSETIEKMGDK